MSSFRTAVAVQSVHVDRVPCRVRVFLESLEPAERVDVAEAIDDLTLTAPALASTILDRYDFAIAHQVVARHRRRLYGNGCKCE